MKNIILTQAIFFITFISGYVLACETSIIIENQKYCIDIEWLNAESCEQKSVSENLDCKKTDFLSPYLVPMGSRLKIYSKVKIKIWKQNDKDKKSLIHAKFNPFPYMIMYPSMHHGGYHQIDIDYDDNSYIISQIRFFEMSGCWQLRWSEIPDLDEKDQLNNSKEFINIKTYSNQQEHKLDQSPDYWCEKIQQ
jgi:hypothetical protein